MNDDRLFNPRKMVREIKSMIHPEAANGTHEWPEILASTYISLGESYAQCWIR
ncbi:MAG: hypothetical protein ACLVJO_02815 [[Clostridium] scindens]